MQIARHTSQLLGTGHRSRRRQERFVTRFVTRVTRFVTKITRFVTRVTRFVKGRSASTTHVGAIGGTPTRQHRLIDRELHLWGEERAPW